MYYSDIEYPSLKIKASSKQNAIKMFRRIYGYVPKDFNIKQETFKDSKYHLKFAYQHEKEMK
jgi:hypothetical protein